MPVISDISSPKAMRLQIAALVGVFVFLYSSVLRDLAGIWWGSDTHSHGFLILPISLYLVWAKRSDLRQLPLKQCTVWGLSLVLVAGLLLLLGMAGHVAVLGGLSFVGMIVGLVLLLLGKAYLKALAFPIAYLLFMTPLFDYLLSPLHWPLQLLTASMGVRLLQTLGVPAFVEQQFIVLRRVTLEVATVCSGTNYLISILAVGLPLAYLTLRTWGSRVALILWGVAIGLAANWVRVVLIGMWANWDGEVLHGPGEMFRAMFVAWLGVLGLVVGAWGLAKMQKAAAQDHGTKLPVRQRSDGESCPPVEWNRSWRIALVALILLGVYATVLDRGPVEMKEDLSTFPISIDGWLGKQADLRDAVFRIEGADQELLRVYQNPESRPIQLYVAYLASQRQRKTLVDYRTAVLHEGAEALAVTLPPGRVVTVNRGRFRGAGTEHQLVFWYDMNGRIIRDRYRAKLETMRDALVHGRSNGALVLIAGGPGDEAQMELFTRDLVPRLRASFP